MAIGRTFKEAFQKAIRSLEIGRHGFGADIPASLGPVPDLEQIEERLRVPNSRRIFFIRDAFRRGLTIDKIYELTKIDPWFLTQLYEIYEMELSLLEMKDVGKGPHLWDKDFFRMVKAYGFSDRQIATIFEMNEEEVRKIRYEREVFPVYKLVDTCAAEFEAYTPYYYSSYEKDNEIRKSKKKKVVILGGGPNRIGQGIEFDYCCVHASLALREMGIESIMVNSNPETVSTDYDISDRLYFEPVTTEDVLNLILQEEPEGVIVQFGGQTPLNISVPLAKAGVKILGTTPESIYRAEDRDKFQALVEKLGLRQPENGVALSLEEAVAVAEKIGYPVMVRPSFVLGGRAMEIVYDRDALIRYVERAIEASPGAPILIDRFLEDAIEIDVDAISDGRITVIGGIMEHIEEAGIHSGDSACVLPSISLSKAMINQIMEDTKAIAKELEVIGLMNVQYAVKDKTLYVLEVNPRASRTVPFVSKAIGVPLAKLATKVIMGMSLEDLGFTQEVIPSTYPAKRQCFPLTGFQVWM
jgi:carbamoyl-phosphate synthase large subunit